MIEVKSGQIFVNGKLTTDPTLIGYALLDIAETITHNLTLTPEKLYSNEQV